MIDNMILSHSGWRGIFTASGDEEDRSGEIGAAHRMITAGAACVFAEYLQSRQGLSPLVLVGCDTRPTGKTIAGVLIPALLACGCRVCYAGITASPEIMTWARSTGNHAGFIYITASHNPIGHNGFKFGLTDGGVIDADQSAELICRFRTLMEEPGISSRLEKLITGADPDALQEILTAEPHTKARAWDAYYTFSNVVAWGYASAGAAASEAASAAENFNHNLGVCCDFNGSARCVSIDREFFTNAGIQFEAINAEPGKIVHRIIPEGASLEPCRQYLEELHCRNPAFILGYVPDCDGDRGNLVMWDEALGKARTLEAQEVFALVCMAELAFAPGEKPAVVVNDPTSLRIDRIAAAFGAPVFRAEVGEANVVGLARRLREDGYTVRILGEGSNGGNITHPSAVRDPLHTVLAIARLLSFRSEHGKPGLFEKWCTASGQRQLYHPGFTLADIIASLPPFHTTGTDDPQGILKIASTDQNALKRRYQLIFLEEWEKYKDPLMARYGIHGWAAAVYNGMVEQKGIADFGQAGTGGLKICFHDEGGTDIASIWMRRSATEPVFRIIADAQGTDKQAVEYLQSWQRRMIIKADTLPGV